MPVLLGDGKQVDYQEMADGGSPVYQLAHGNSHVEKTFRVAWADRIVFTQLCLGYPKISNVRTADPNDPRRAFISRVTPMPLTDFLSPQDGKPWLYANTITRMEGAGPVGTLGADGSPTYKYALVTVAYESVTYKIIDDANMPTLPVVIPGVLLRDTINESSMLRYVTRTRKPSVEFLNLGRGNRKWVDLVPDFAIPPFSHAPYDGGYAVPNPAVEIQLTHHQVPYVPEAAHKYLGCVNKFAVTENDKPDELKVTYPAGTLLLCGADIRQYRMGSGVFVQDVCYRLKLFNPGWRTNSPRGHNFFLKFFGDSQIPVRTKLTHNGRNDSQLIPGSGVVGDLYRFDEPARAANGGIPVFHYADFDFLFTFFCPDPDLN